MKDNTTTGRPLFRRGGLEADGRALVSNGRHESYQLGRYLLRMVIRQLGRRCIDTRFMGRPQRGQRGLN